MSTNTKKSNTRSPRNSTKKKSVKKKRVKRKTGVLSSSLTVNTTYARVALVLLALNLLFMGYVLAKLST
jgi:hypothetical protein